MSKKTADREKDQKKDAEEEDEDEDLEDEDEDEEEEDEEEEDDKPAAAQPIDSRRARPRARRDDAHDDHGHARDEEESAEDDPYWWTPHAVMSGLVLVGVLGFFGVFNKVLGGIAAKPSGAGHDTPAATVAAAAANTANRPPEQREEFGAKHLLVQYKGSMRASPAITRTEDEAKARATEAMKKARSGTNFADVVKEYSDEPGAAQRGGDLGKFRKGQMVPEFQTAVEKMKVGEISDLVKTPFGYHVIQRTQ